MDISTRHIGTDFVIDLTGRFDFHTNRDFRECYLPALARNDIKTIKLNMSRIDYLDCSALGMLLLLKEKSASVKKDIVIISVSVIVMKNLEIANLNKLFKIESMPRI